MKTAPSKVKMLPHCFMTIAEHYDFTSIYKLIDVIKQCYQGIEVNPDAPSFARYQVFGIGEGKDMFLETMLDTTKNPDLVLIHQLFIYPADAIPNEVLDRMLLYDEAKKLGAEEIDA